MILYPTHYSPIIKKYQLGNINHKPHQYNQLFQVMKRLKQSKLSTNLYFHRGLKQEEKNQKP